MEKVKNDKKAKRNTHPDDYYRQGWAFAIITTMFLLLTLVTSYKILLPLPQVFAVGSIMIGIVLCGFYVFLGSVWRNIPIAVKYVYIIAIFAICTSLVIFNHVLMIGITASWICGIFWYLAFQYIPIVIFPILFLATILLAISTHRRAITVPRRTMKMWTYGVMLFTIVYIWGQASRFEGKWHDEGLKIEGTSYHAIVDYGWLGQPVLVFLYECNFGNLGCNLIYESEYDYYYRAESQLVNDEEAGLLRLEYHPLENQLQSSDIPPILYEHPIRQE